MIKQGEALILLGRLFSKQSGEDEVEVTDLDGYEFCLSLQLQGREYHRAQATCYDEGYFSFVVDSSLTASLDPFIYQMEVGMTIGGGRIVCRQEIPLEVRRSVLGRVLSSAESAAGVSTSATESQVEVSNESVQYRIELVQSGDEMSCSSWSDSSLIDLYLGHVIKGEQGESGTDGYTPIKGVDYYADINIVQQMGDDSDVVMSQKAATESFVAYSSSLAENFLAYGIQFDTTISDPTCTRIGNMTLHKSLPIQSGMRGCILDDDGVVVEYLPADDWTGSTRDGSTGQVMVEIPKHYRKFVTNGTVRQVWISEYQLDGYHEVPMAYISAYEATIDQEDTDNLKLASVVSMETRYRGGNYDWTGSNPVHIWDRYPITCCGRPVSYITRTNARERARNRKSNSYAWNILTYDIRKSLCWLIAVEFSSLDSQLPINNTLTADGYRQGGLGMGTSELTTLDGLTTGWYAFNGSLPFVPCGHTDSFGNSTGECEYDAYRMDGTFYYTFKVCRYRGIENIIGHLEALVDGVTVDSSERGSDNEYSRIYITGDITKFSDDSIEDYEYVADLDTSISGAAYITDILFGDDGHIIPVAAPGTGSSSTYFCDHQESFWVRTGLLTMAAGGAAMSYKGAGIFYSRMNQYITTENIYSGSRLCFIPQDEE